MLKSKNLLRRTAAVMLAVLVICGSAWSMTFASDAGAAGSVSDNSAEPAGETVISAEPAGETVISEEPAEETVVVEEASAAPVGSGVASGTENSPNFLAYLGLADTGKDYYAFLRKYSSENPDTGFFMGTPYTNTVNMAGSDITSSGFRGAWFMASPRGNNRQGINISLANAQGDKYRGGMNCTGFGTALFSQFGTEEGRNVDALLPGKRQNGEVLSGFMGYDWNYFMPGNPGCGTVKLYLFSAGGRSGSQSGNWEAAKQEMLASGVLEYGDIIYSLPLDTSKQVSGSWDTHWGVYLGDGHSDVYWHSAYSNDLVNTVGQLVNTSSSNVITGIVPKYANVTFAVIKVGAIPVRNGYLQVVKEVKPRPTWEESAPEGAVASFFIGGDYETEGTVYTVYSDAACTTKAGTLTIGKHNTDEEAKAAGKYTARSNVIELPAGRYYVKETETPNVNLELDTKVYTVDVTENHTVTVPCAVTSTDYPKMGWLRVVKQSTDPIAQASLAGAEFTLYMGYDEKSKTCTGEIGTVRTEQNGTTKWFNAPITDLWIVETAAPEGYEANETPVHVQGLTAEWVNRKTVTINERPYYARIRINKTSSREIPDWLSEEDRANYYRNGAAYSVYSDPDGDGKSTELVKTVEISKLSGASDVFKLPIGHYFAVETVAPANYALNKEVVPFDVTAENCCDNPAVVDAGILEIEGQDEPCFARIKIRKASAETIPDWVEDRTRYYRDGAVYEIYYDPDRDGRDGVPAATVKTVTVSGSSDVFELPIGHYYALETEGPTNGGYKINELPVPFDVTADNCRRDPATGEAELMTVDTVDEIIFGGLRIEKVPDRDSETFAGGSGYSLKGAKFSVYSARTLDESSLVGTLTTGSGGMTEVLTGLAPGTYYMVETMASDGFVLPTDDFTKANPHAVTISAEDLTRLTTVTCYEPALYSSVDLKIRKKDAVTGDPVGKADLAGAQFEIRYYDGYYEKGSLPEKALRTWTVQTVLDRTSGEYAASLSIKGSLVGAASDDLYEYGGKTVIPCGTLAVVETKAPDGYKLPEDPMLLVKQITAKTIAAEKAAGTAETTVTATDEVIRGGFQFVKTDQDGSGLKGVPFLVTSATTGESHVVVTDESGRFSTENEKHSLKTNENDKAYSGGKLDASKLDPSAGVWFSGTKDPETLHVDDSLGALPYDDYVITELRAPANAGMTLIDPIRVSINRDGAVIDLGQFVDNKKIISTAVISGLTGTQTTAAVSGASFTDTVRLEGFAGDCVVRTSVADTGTGETILLSDGSKEVVNEVRAENKETEVTVTFAFDASALAGRKAAVVTVVENGGEETVHNADLADEAEMIYIPKLATEAVNAATGGKTIPSEGEAAIVDRVSFSGFRKSEKMSTVTEAWVRGDVPGDDTLLAKAESTVTAEDESGTYEIALTADLTGLAGRDIYIVEKNYIGGVLVAEEGGRDSRMQTVTSAKIGTTLTDEETLTHISLAGDEVINVDRIRYAGLEAGKTYPVIGILMNEEGYAWKKDGTVYEKEKAEELNAYREGLADLFVEKTPEEKLAAVRENLEELEVIFASAEFTAEAAEGEAEVLFSYDGRPLAGQKVVAGETVYEAGELLAVHFDPEDEDQAVYLPKIVTRAGSSADGSRSIGESRAASITDTLYYEMYPAGSTVRTVLELFNADTGEALTEDGKPVTAETIFYPEGCGEISVTVTFDSTGYGDIRIGLAETNYVEANDTWVPCAADSYVENEEQVVVHVPKEVTPPLTVLTPTPSIAVPSIAVPTPSIAVPAQSAAVPEPSVREPEPSGAAATPTAPRTADSAAPVATGDPSGPILWMMAALLAAYVLKTLIKYRNR